MELIEREEEVIVVDSDNEVHEFTKMDEETVRSVDASDEAVNYIVFESEYSLDHGAEFPVEFEDILHLEDGPAYNFEVENRVLAASMGAAELPTYQLKTVWEVNEDGDMKLMKVEYDGTTFTPESD